MTVDPLLDLLRADEAVLDTSVWPRPHVRAFAEVRHGQAQGDRCQGELAAEKRPMSFMYTEKDLWQT